jgi:hypothetical protein
VRPLHFSLHWDGATLRIADTYGAGDVRLDGVPVTAQWRAIAGRVRIDFGKAAMVAETSASAESEAHPLEPSPLPPMAAGPAQHKSTLMGVSPLASDPPVELVTPRSTESSPPKTSASSPPNGSDSNPPGEGTGSFRVARPSDSERVRKATLMGIAISAPPPAPVPEIGVSEPRSEPAPKPATPPRGIPSGTLIGVVGPLEARVQRLASAAQDGKLSDKRTMLGVPLKDLRLEAPTPQIRTASDAPAGIVTQAEVRTVSSAPVANAPGAERIGSTWQEIPNAARQGSAPPMAVLVDGPGAAQAPRHVENDVAARRPNYERERGSSYDTRDRVSDIPTQMRDVASLESRRPKRSIPLRYIGIVALTAAAYMAWLYLLDHL